MSSVLTFDSEERKVLDEIFDQTYSRLTEESKKGRIKDHDAIISSTLAFIETVIPKILKCYKGEAYENKCKGIAASLRITIWSIMPFDKFTELMARKEMKILDMLVKDLVERGEGNVSEETLEGLFKYKKEEDVEEDTLEGIFKKNARAKDIYH
jgi:hypothetical protein